MALERADHSVLGDSSRSFGLGNLCATGKADGVVCSTTIEVEIGKLEEVYIRLRSCEVCDPGLHSKVCATTTEGLAQQREGQVDLGQGRVRVFERHRIEGLAYNIS